MPPASPVPGWCSGEVWTESIATRRGLRCSLSREGVAGERRPSLLTYWLTWRSSLLRACRSEDARHPPESANAGAVRSISLPRPLPCPFAESLPRVAQPFDGELRARPRSLLRHSFPQVDGGLPEVIHRPARASSRPPTLVRMTTRAASRPVGTVTRGTTNPNRLRRMDRWIAATHGAELRRSTDPMAVDLGYGAAPWTAVELLTRLRENAPRTRVVGVEIEPARVAAARPYEREGLVFRHGGFEIPLSRRPQLIRAAN